MVRRWGVEAVGRCRGGGSDEGGTRLGEGEAVQCAVAAVFLAFVRQAPLVSFFVLDSARMNRSWAVYTPPQRTVHQWTTSGDKTNRAVLLLLTLAYQPLNSPVALMKASTSCFTRSRVSSAVCDAGDTSSVESLVPSTTSASS